MKKQTLLKKKKYNVEQGDKSTRRKKKVQKVGTEVLRYNPQNKTVISQCHHESIDTLNVFKYFVFCNKGFLF